MCETDGTSSNCVAYAKDKGQTENTWEIKLIKSAVFKGAIFNRVVINHSEKPHKSMKLVSPLCPGS